MAMVSTAVCAPVVGMLGVGGRLWTAFCSMSDEGGASWVCVWVSLGDVFVGVVAGWVAGGGAPGG